MKKYIFNLFVCALCLISALSYGQNYSYKHYTVFDGLAQSQVTCLYQDHLGFIWIGTKGGISRFDGVSFKNYTEGIPYGHLFSITEDKNNRLYCFSHYGCSVLRDGSFHKVTDSKTQIIQSVFRDYSGNIFFADGNNTIYKCDNKSFSIFFQNKNINGISRYFSNSKDKKEYFETDSFIYRITSKNKAIPVCENSSAYTVEIAGKTYIYQKSNEKKAGGLYVLSNDSCRLLFSLKEKRSDNYNSITVYNSNKLFFTLIPNRYQDRFFSHENWHIDFNIFCSLFNAFKDFDNCFSTSSREENVWLLNCFCSLK